MPMQIAGVMVAADEVRVALLTKNDDDTFAVDDETTFRLQAGGRPGAYDIVQQQFRDYIRQHKVECVCIKGSAVSRNFGERKVDEYLKDNDFWDDIGLCDVKKGMREPAFAVISQFKDS